MLVKKNIEYLGINNPNTQKQIQVEIHGLKQVIRTAQELISRLEQAIAIAEFQKEEMLKNAELQKNSTKEDHESKTQEGNGKTDQET